MLSASARSQSSLSTAGSGCFDGKHVVFWTRSHTATLKQKAAQAGAILEDRVSELTQLVVAARDTSATDAAAHLADLPKAIPLLSKKWEGRRLKIPTKVDFVVPQYISDCLVQNRILPSNAYLIALQQVASKDTRTYSHEELAGKSSQAQEVDQVQPEQQAHIKQPQPSPAIIEQLAQDAPNTSAGIAQQPYLSAPASASVSASVSASAATISGQQAPPAAKQESSNPAKATADPNTKRLGIYPDINPQGRAFTGGHTGIPWGTGGSTLAKLPAITIALQLAGLEHISALQYRQHDAGPNELDQILQARYKLSVHGITYVYESAYKLSTCA